MTEPMDQPFNPSQPLALYSQAIRSDPVIFINEILGLPVHEDQFKWIRSATKKINILRPGNRWGKSLIEACLHIYHGIVKPNLAGYVANEDEWQNTPYETLNFGPGYEQAREVLRLARDIVEGRILIPKSLQSEWGRVNNSMLKGWAIAEDHSEANMLPHIVWATGAKLLGRSYSEMGAAFKAKALAFISGDECADIQELWGFTNVTLLPRLVSLRGILHFVGTVQAEGYDYLRMIEMAEEDMARDDWEKSGMYYVQKGTMYDNPFLDEKEIQATERIADSDMARQVIYGEYVEMGNKYFGAERISNAVDKTLTQLEQGIDGRKYITSVDFAAGESAWADSTVIKVFDFTDERAFEVFHYRVKGGDMPIPLQYKMVEDIVMKFPGKLIIDASALGGKNAFQFLKHLNPIGLQMTPKTKGDILSTLKIAFDGGQSVKYRRQKTVDQFGAVTDDNPDWGTVRLLNVPESVRELVDYKLDDKKLRTDCVMTIAMAIYFVEMRRPIKRDHNRMMPWDLAAVS